MVTDEDLFRAWQHGDAGALETLVQRYHAPLLAHLYRVLADTHLAEDLVQETFLRLIRDAQSYQYPRYEVGGQRVALRYVSNRRFPNRAGYFHSTRLSRSET